MSSVILLLGSYLLGSLPVAASLARRGGLDPAREFDLHLSTWRKLGPRVGLAAIFSDMCKGIFPVVVGYLAGFPVWVVVMAGVAAVAGQMWPVFLRFDGEKGNTTGVGTGFALVLCYQAWPVLLAVLPMLVAAGMKALPSLTCSGASWGGRFRFEARTNAMPLGMLAGFLLAPATSYVFRQGTELTGGLLAASVLIILRRVTARPRGRLEDPAGPGRMVFNRFFYDRD